MSDWKKIVGSVAPTIATALGGPLAGVATKFLAENLLGDSGKGVEDIEKYISGATPEQLVQMKQIEAQFKIEMKKADIDVQKLAVDDRKSARELFKINVWPQIILSSVFIVGYFGILWLLFGGTIVLDTSIRDMAGILLGVLTSGIPMILRFWFGGSPQDEAHMDRIYNSVPHGKN